MFENLNKIKFYTRCINGSDGLSLLPDKSIKLIYGSPPYPNALRDYGMWSSDDYIEKISPFIVTGKTKLKDDGFFVINIKANRERKIGKNNTTRSFIVEKLAIMMSEIWGLYCVDIEIWVKDNPVSTGLRVACQDAYEQNLWFAKNPIWKINLDAIRRPYSENTIKIYQNSNFNPRSNGLTYVRKPKKISANPLGALPINIIKGSVSSSKGIHQAVQPGYLSEKYIKATTVINDIVVDPWMGTGTTGEEALKLGRLFIGFDISAEYITLANNRLRKTIDSLNEKTLSK